MVTASAAPVWIRDGTKTMDKNTLGEIICRLRRKAGLTQEALAEGICSPVSVSRIENGKQMPSGKVLEQLLERLGTGTYQLCNVYYENECQASLHQTLTEIGEQVSAGDFVQAREALQQLSTKKMDSVNLQHTKMLLAAIRMQENSADADLEAELINALCLTKPDIDLEDCRSELFSPTEINLLVMLTAAKYMEGKNLEAIRLGEEVMFALDRNQSRLSDYKIFQINLAYNLGKILQAEERYKEAILYAKKAEEISIRGTEQFLLPEIEFEIAQILGKMGKPQESRTRIEALIPYMRLVGKTQMADFAQEFLDENLSNDVN
jgi:transcriptional regulator with XRE-family HTH domain